MDRACRMEKPIAGRETIDFEASICPTEKGLVVVDADVSRMPVDDLEVGHGLTPMKAATSDAASLPERDVRSRRIHYLDLPAVLDRIVGRGDYVAHEAWRESSKPNDTVCPGSASNTLTPSLARIPPCLGLRRGDRFLQLVLNG